MIDISNIASTFTSYLQTNGCSPFFITGALQSAVFGKVARTNQAKLLKSNLEFKERLQEIRDKYSAEKLEEQLWFRRESYELGKQFLIQQTAEQSKGRQQEIEFQYFCNNCWPLDISVYTVLSMQRDLLCSSSIIPINLLIAKTEVSSYDKTKKQASYKGFCSRVEQNLRQLPNINTSMMRAWKNDSQSILCDAMNINYIMRGIPTLMISPYQIGETLNIEMSVWSFRSDSNSMFTQKIFSKEGVGLVERIDIAVAAIRAIAGMVRDTYMICEYQKPALFLQTIKDEDLVIPEIKEMIFKHYNSLKEQVITNKKILELCSNEEKELIFKSLNTNLLK